MTNTTKSTILVIQDLREDLTNCVNKAMEQGLSTAVINMIVKDLQITLRGLEQKELKRATELMAQTKEE